MSAAANHARGEAALDLGGRTIALRPSFAALVAAEEELGPLFELVERVTVLQEGRLLVEGTPDEIRGNADVQEAYLGGIHDEVAPEAQP